MDIREIWAVMSRHILLAIMWFLPVKRRVALERRLRGKEEFRKLQRADWVLMSWGKSGRTWFRVMLSRFYQLRYSLPSDELLGFDNLHRKNSQVPKILFSHNNYMRDYLNDWDTLEHFRSKKIVLLVRDPRDVAVSQYFQWRFRMRPHKKLLNSYPPHGEDISIFDFVMNRDAGIPRIIEFFNDWAKALSEQHTILLIRYEDMRTDPQEVMKRVVEFVGESSEGDEIQQAVEFAAYENMKKLEKKQFFRNSGVRVKPGDKDNPDSFKVRRGKVGGYRDYFQVDEISIIDNLVEQQLDPVFAYQK
jgi:hypothetical protein